MLKYVVYIITGVIFQRLHDRPAITTAYLIEFFPFSPDALTKVWPVHASTIC